MRMERAVLEVDEREEGRRKKQEVRLKETRLNEWKGE